MNIIRNLEEMREWSISRRKEGRTLGFVPTMGALHEGHVSLCARARKGADRAIMSIFVNPPQFGPKEDFSAYPRPFEEDCAVARAAGCDAVFAPRDSDMYPAGYATWVTVEHITERLCGAGRPGHFRGVPTVVLKLFNIVQPTFAVFGQKDAQQCLVLRRMVADLNMPVRIVVAPTVREADGLAMSSRNRYLDSDERAAAPALYGGLCDARSLYDKGERGAAVLRRAIENAYGRSRLFKPEYIDIVDTLSVMPVETLNAAALAAVAVRTAHSNTRLIDNIVLGGDL